MTFKDLKKKVSLEVIEQQSRLFSQQQKEIQENSCLKDFRINPFGYGILKSIKKKISKQMEIAALIILLVYPRRTEMISLSIIMKE